jgi:hypothetical protein
MSQNLQHKILNLIKICGLLLLALTMHNYVHSKYGEEIVYYL